MKKNQLPDLRNCETQSTINTKKSHITVKLPIIKDKVSKVVNKRKHYTYTHLYCTQ